MCLLLNEVVNFERKVTEYRLNNTSTTILNKYRIVWHLLFWLAYILFFSIQSSIVAINSFWNIISSYCLYVIAIMLATYFSIYFLIPKYLLNKKYYHFFTILFISAIFFTLLQKGIVYYVIMPLLYSPQAVARITKLGFFDINSLLSNLVSIYTVVAVAASIKLLKSLYKNQQTTQLLNQQKLETELKFLKSQINPHFLFNSLNNLYGLALKKSDKTPESILKLSSLLSYMLYECDSPKIPLEKEIGLLNDFIGLEKLRYGNRLELQFTINGDVEGIEVAPMLLFPFVENSFKHGASNEIEKAWININININPTMIALMVENKKSNLGSNTSKEDLEGIGLKNVKRQLDLLYPSKYELEIENKDESFKIILKLHLN